MSSPVAVILAAGKSTRMKSDIPKVIHTVCGRPMIEYVLDAARTAGVKRIVVVVGHKANVVKEALSSHDDVEFALQADQHGTGHAVMMCADNLSSHDGPVLVLSGDTPLIRSESLAGLLEELNQSQAACVVGTAVTEANKGLGRILRDDANKFVRIVEEKDANEEEAAIQEINTGCYAFDNSSLFAALEKLKPNNKQSEYYLTDCAEILKNEGRTVVASQQFNILEAKGVNTQEQLAEIETILQQSADGV